LPAPPVFDADGATTTRTLAGAARATLFASGAKTSAQRLRGRGFFLSTLDFGAGATTTFGAGTCADFTGVLLPVGREEFPRSQARRALRAFRRGSLRKVTRNLTRRGAFCLINHAGVRKFFQRPLYRVFSQRRYGLRRRFLQRERTFRRRRRVRAAPRRTARHIRFQRCNRCRRGVASSLPLRAIFSKHAGATRRLIRRIARRELYMQCVTRTSLRPLAVLRRW